MATAKVKIGVAPSNFAGISTLAGNVIVGLTGNVNFVTPNPTIVVLTGAKATLDAAIAAWGPVGNRGSHADYLDLVAKALTMRNLLLTEGDYVELTASLAAPDYATQAAIIVTSGFAVKNLPSPQGLLGPPTGLIRRMSDAISEDNIMLDWQKPLGLTSPNNVKTYKIFQDAVQIGISTKTSFLITAGIVHGNTYTFEIIPVNSAGDGVTSLGLIINF